MSREASFFETIISFAIRSADYVRRLCSHASCTMPSPCSSSSPSFSETKNVRFPPMRLCSLVHWHRVMHVPPYRYPTLPSGAVLTRIYFRDHAVRTATRARSRSALPRCVSEILQWLATMPQSIEPDPEVPRTGSSVRQAGRATSTASRQGLPAGHADMCLCRRAHATTSLSGACPSSAGRYIVLACV